MLDEFRSSRAFVAAASLGVAATIGVFFFAPAPPDSAVGQNAGRGRARFPEREWKEWRTPAFHAMRASLDRADPERVVRAVFDAHKADKYDLALAYGAEARQRRWMPEWMREQFADAPALSRPVSLRLGEPTLMGRRAAVPLESAGAEGEPYAGRALLQRDAGGWALEVIVPGDAPERRLDESERRYAARLVAPMARIFTRAIDDSSPASLADEFIVALLAGETTPLMAMSARAGGGQNGFHGGAWRQAFSKPNLLEASDVRLLRLEERPDGSAAALLGVEIGERALRYEVLMARVGDAANAKWRVMRVMRAP